MSWVTVERVAQQLLWLMLFSILAPILGPRAYGEFSIVMVFIGFCELVLGDGMVEVLVTLVDLEPSHAATTNLIASAAAIGLGLLLAGIAPVVGATFGDDEIRNLMWALALLPLFSFSSAAPIASLRRGSEFRRLAIRSIVSLALGGAAGIGVALAGGGVWALAVQVVTQRFCEAVIAWGSVPLRFEFVWSNTHFQEMKPIGVNIFTARLMMFASGQTPRIVLGYVLGPVQVGLFTLAGRFLDIVMYTAVFPRIAVARIELRNWKPGSSEFTRLFSAMVRDVVLISAPLLLGAATVMHQLYRVWLDPRWLAGVVPAQLLLLSGLPLALVYCYDAAFLAARLPALFSRTSAIQAMTTTAAVVVVAPFGLDVACVALLIRSWAVMPIYAVWLHRACKVVPTDYLRLPLRLVFGASLMVAALHIPWWRPSDVDRPLGLIALILEGVLSYGAFCFIFARQELRAFLAGFVSGVR